MQFSKSFQIVLLVVLVMTINFWGCGSGMKSIDSFDKLQPIEDLPMPTGDHNLVVKINNVADVGTSNKNWAELYINNKHIRLAKEVKGYQQDYSFHFRLKSGVYKIKAIYFAKAGKKEYKITTDNEKFKVYPDRRTVLSITLDKKLNGELKTKKNYFTESTESLFVGSSQSKVTQTTKSVLNSKTPPALATKAKEPKPLITQAVDKITMQIQSTPSSAKIYIDDEFYGYSPLKVDVSRTQHHEVKFSLAGFKRKIVFIDSKYFRSKDVFHLQKSLRPKRRDNRK